MAPNAVESQANTNSSPDIHSVPNGVDEASTGAGAQAAANQTSEKEDIWSSILKGVASSKIVTTKSVLILGDPQTGKSTLIHHLKYDSNPTVNPDGTTTVDSGVGTQTIDKDEEEENGNELALSYTFADITDEENEDTIARLNLYHLSLSHTSYSSLLKFAINSTTLPDSLVIIVLDWTRPWTFVEQLERWLKILQTHVETEVVKEGMTVSGWSKGKEVVDELKEKIERYVQQYTEPAAADASGAAPAIPATAPAAATEQVTLPLPPGSLTKNLAIPIVVVCCKSDAMGQLERQEDYKEEQFDYIQQTLRTICLKYGATLFYTATGHPQTFPNLRTYIMHRLIHTGSKPFPFNQRAQVIERDTVLVPAGWDSWGKIKVLREGFDCDGVSRGWDMDLGGKIDSYGDEEEVKVVSAKEVYKDVIKGRQEDTQIVLHPPTTWEDEQVFYEKHFETLQRPVESRPGGHPTSTGMTPGVVGPMGVSANSINLTATLEQDNIDEVAAKLARFRKEKPTSPTMPSPTTSTTTGTGSGQGAASTEVLANFFQSLLSKKGAMPGPVGGSVGNSTSPNGSSVNISSSTTSVSSQKEMKERLERMRTNPGNGTVSK